MNTYYVYMLYLTSTVLVYYYHAILKQELKHNYTMYIQL